jgi:Short C-terminal domain
MPRLIGMAARTAVVAGTATHVSNNVNRRQQEKYAAQDQQQYAQQPPPQQYAPPPPPPPVAAAPAADPVEQLQKLAVLKDQGVLTEEEFASEKAKILAS